MQSSGSITKCVILARGLGTRMRRDDPAASLNPTQATTADAGLKAMIPIGRPFLDYVLSALADAAFDQVCLVIGPEHGAVRDYYTKTIRVQRLRISFAMQQRPLGSANAVLAAEEFIGEDQFLVINSDNYYPVEVLTSIQNLRHPGTVLFHAAALIQHSNIPVDRLRAFASCVVDEHGFLTDIMEKPASGSADFTMGKLVSMNCWRFRPDILTACRNVQLSPRGEYELPLAVKLALQLDIRLKVSVSDAGVLDLSRRSDIAPVAERLKNVQVRL